MAKTHLIRAHESLPPLGPALTKVMSQVAPGWASWASADREAYAADISDEDAVRIDCGLLAEMFEIEVGTRQEVDAILEEMGGAQADAFERERIPVFGVGADAFCFTEHLAGPSDAIQFDTLGDFERDSRALVSEAMGGLNAFFMRSGDPVMHLEGDRLVRARVWSAAAFLADRVEDRLDDLVAVLVPHEFTKVRRVATCRWVPALNQWLDAHGREHVLDLIGARKDEFVRALGDECDRYFEYKPPCVYMEDGHGGRAVVFSNVAAMDRVRIRNFVADCSAIRAPFSSLTKAVTNAGVVAEQGMRQAYEAIREAWPDNVVPFPARQAATNREKKTWTDGR